MSFQIGMELPRMNLALPSRDGVEIQLFGRIIFGFTVEGFDYGSSINNYSLTMNIYDPFEDSEDEIYVDGEFNDSIQVGLQEIIGVIMKDRSPAFGYTFGAREIEMITNDYIKAVKKHLSTYNVKLYDWNTGKTQ